MRVIVIVSGLCAAALAACEPSGDPPPLARQLFDKNVDPLLQTTCMECHSNPDDPQHAPDFLELVPHDHYASLVARRDFVRCDVENSLLLNKGLLDPAHPGGKLLSGQRGEVRGWLEQEAIERFHGACQKSPPDSPDAGPPDSPDAGPPVAPLTGLDALKQFGDCMTLEAWNATNMPLVAEQITVEQITGGDQVEAPCYSCHDSGPGLNYMPDPNGSHVGEAFQKMSQVYSIFKLVRWTVHDEDGSFKDIVQSHRWRDKGSDPDHPSYELKAEYQGYVDAWFQQTYDLWRAGGCAQ